MKKLVLTAFVAICSTVLFAQQTSATTPAPAASPAVINTDPNHTPSSVDKKNDMKDMRHDIRDKRKDKRQRAEDLENGNKQGAANMTQDIRNDKKDIKGDATDLKRDGVKHPIRRADHQIARHHHHHRH